MSWEAWVGVGAAAAGGSLLLARRLTRRRPRGIPVLRYGLVGPPRAGSPLNDLRVPMSRFRAQLRHLARRGFRAVTLSEALEARGRRDFLDSNPVVLTFDGAWRSFLAAVWPALSEHGLGRVTLFYPAARLDQEAVHYAEGRPEPLLSRDELRLLAADGVEVGLLSNEDAGRRIPEVVARWRSEAKAVGQVVGGVPRLLALPSRVEAAGPYTRAAREAGFQAAVRAGGGGILTRWSPRHSLPRYSVLPGTDVVHLAYCLSRRRD